MGFLVILLLASELLPFVRGVPGNGLAHTLAMTALAACQGELDDRRRAQSPAKLVPPPVDAPEAVQPQPHPHTPHPLDTHRDPAPLLGPWHVVPEHPLRTRNA